jgi:hypothetical protein
MLFQKENPILITIITVFYEDLKAQLYKINNDFSFKKIKKKFFF